MRTEHENTALHATAHKQEVGYLAESVAAFIAAVLLSLALFAFGPGFALAAPVSDTANDQAAAQLLQQAFEDAANASSSQQAADTLQQAFEDAAALQAQAEAEEQAAAPVQIEDEENPLAASPTARTVNNFVWLLLAGAIGLAAFFLLYTRRLNSSIKQMRRFVD